MLFLSQRRDNQTLVLWLPFRSSSFRWPQVQLNLYSVSNMFGNWIQGISKDLKPLVLLGAAATYWSIWLCRNDIVFENKNSSPFRLSSWLFIDIICGLSSKSRTHKIWLWLFCSTWYMWPWLSSPRHMDNVLVFGLIVTRVCVVYSFDDCVLSVRQRPE